MHLPNQEPEILIIKNETKIIITLIRVTKNKMIVCYNSKETKVIITDTTKILPNKYLLKYNNKNMTNNNNYNKI